jgi:hypothetical protein
MENERAIKEGGGGEGKPDLVPSSSSGFLVVGFFSIFRREKEENKETSKIIGLTFASYSILQCEFLSYCWLWELNMDIDVHTLDWVQLKKPIEIKHLGPKKPTTWAQ